MELHINIPVAEFGSAAGIFFVRQLFGNTAYWSGFLMGGYGSCLFSSFVSIVQQFDSKSRCRTGTTASLGK